METLDQEFLDVYNINGIFQGRTILRGEQLKKDEYHLAVQVWVKNSSQAYLIQKRAEHLTVLPRIWAATAGAVLAGETSLEAAIRELAEELAINANPEEIQQKYREIYNQSISTAWLLEREIHDNEIEIQKSEVSATMWASAEKIKQMVSENKFYDYGTTYFEHIFSE